jgi:hypothetical protein
MDPQAAFNATDEKNHQFRIYLLENTIYFMDAKTMLHSFEGVVYVKNPAAEADRHRRNRWGPGSYDPEAEFFRPISDFFRWLAGDVDYSRFRQMAWADEVGELARRPLSERLVDHASQFAVRPADFASGSLEPPAPSFWYSDYGCWRFIAGDQGERAFHFASEKDLMTAVNHLPALLRNNLTVNVAYNPKTRQWERTA